MVMQYYELCTLVVAETIGLQKDDLFVVLDKNLERDPESYTFWLSFTEQDLESVARWYLYMI
jgi:hypothetical protein